MNQPIFPHMRNFRVHRMLAIALVCWLAGLSCDARAQLFGAKKPMTKPKALLSRQAKGVVNNDVESVITQENSRAVVSLSKQRLYLMTGEQIYIDSPISSGKAGHSTPTGPFPLTASWPASGISGIWWASTSRGLRTWRLPMC